MEVWKDVIGYEGRYQVSNEGRVRSISGVLKPVKNHSGYNRVNLYGGDKMKTASVHSLVMAAFVGERPHGAHIEHLNHEKEDNSVSNLKYSDRSENVARGVKDRRYCLGERNANSKLSDQDRHHIVSRYKPKCKENGAVALAKIYGVRANTISKILARWKNEPKNA